MEINASKVEMEHNNGWAKEYPAIAFKSVHEFHHKYFKDFNITINTTKRPGYTFYIADKKNANYNVRND
jgi:hypothetical protein